MIYLDNHSTTQIDSRVLKTMMPYLQYKYGNSSSSHSKGDEAKQAVELARTQVAKLINAEPEQIYFTNSATEANNIVIKGLAFGYQNNQIFITTNSEHSSVNKCFQKIQLAGIKTKTIPIDNQGNVNYESFDDPNITFASIIAANNEIGTIHNLQEISKYNFLFHTDATQALGHLSIDVKKLNLFALSGSAHKIYGPKGVGFIYLRNSSFIDPILDGGYQNILSSGTQNVAAIVGLGAACKILCDEDMEKENIRLSILRNQLYNLLQKQLSDLIMNGTMENRLPNNLNISIPGIKSEALIKGLDDICISGGSACNTGNIEISHVIKALGNKFQDCAIRFGLGRFTTERQISKAAKKIIKVVKEIRGY